MSLNPLKDVQDSVAATIAAHPYFKGLDVITEQRGDILNEIERKIAKIGLCVIVETLTGKPRASGIGSYSLDLDVGISIAERVLINQGATGTKKPAAEVLAMVLCLLNPNRQVPAYAESFSLVNDADGLLVYLVRCKAQAGFQLTE